MVWVTGRTVAVVVVVVRTATLTRTFAAGGCGGVLRLRTQVLRPVLVLIVTKVRVCGGGRNAVRNGGIVDVAVGNSSIVNVAVGNGGVVDVAGAVLNGLKPGWHHAELGLPASG